MTNRSKVRYFATGYKHMIYLPVQLVGDSTFPFKIGDEVVARIEGKKVILEKE